jgi:phage-related minor tail protein
MSKDNVTRRISIFVNGKEVENSLKGVEGAMAQVRNRMRLLNSDSETYEKDSKELAQTMDQLRQRQSAYREELGLTNKTMQEANEISGGLRGTLTGIWDSLVSGDLQGARDGINSLTSGIGGLIKSSLTFAATPLGMLLVGGAAFIAGTKALFDFNKELNDMNSELRALGVNASEISKVRDEISATAETFDKDFKEIAEKANSLSKTYGISMSEANQIIAEGLASGGAQNAEFLDSLGEYDEFFAKAGYSAQEFANVINTGYDLGIYQDKLPDALKEADLALKENTKSTRDALVNAFGASFSDEVLNKVKTGELTTKQALEAIAQKAQESNLSQQQYAQLTADVFKGAGEDAGGAQKIFEALGQSAKRELDATAKASLQLVDANERLNKAQAELFEIKDFGDIWTKIKAVSVDAFASMLEYISEVKQDIQPLIDFVGVVFSNAWESTKATFMVFFELIKTNFKLIGTVISTFVEFFKKIFQGDFSGALDALNNGFLKVVNTIGNAFGKLKNIVLDALIAIISNIAPVLDALGIDVEKLQKTIEGFKSKEVKIKAEVETVTNNKTTNTLSGSGGGGATADELKAQAKARADAAAKQKAEEDKAAKEQYDKAKALADAKANLAKAQLDKYIFDLRSTLDKEKALTPESIAIETERLQKIKDAQIQFNNNELARKIADLEAKAVLEKTSVEVLNAQKEALNLEYQMKNQELELGFQQSTDALKLQYEQEQKILKAEQLLADNELALAEAETKAEADKIKQEQDYQTELQRYAKLYADKKITDEEYTRFKDAAKKKQDEMDRVRELQQLQGTLGGLNQVAGAIGEMFGQSKELAIVQAGINGAMAVTSILAQYPKFDGGFAMWAAIAAAGITTIAQVGKIASAKPPKSPKFFYGGSTGTNAALGYDEYGPVTGYVHKNEYVIPEVMTQDPRFANTIGWLEANRQSKMRGYVDGGGTSPGVVGQNPVETSSNETAMLVNAVNNLNATLSNGIMAKLMLGYKDIEEMEDMKSEINSSSANGTIG